MDHEFFRAYFHAHGNALQAFLADPAHRRALIETVGVLKAVQARDATVYLVGNGGSAAMVEHTATDLHKNAQVRAMTFSATALLTCLANDYGYEQVYERAVERMGRGGDVLIAVSSSGKSVNILRACDAAIAVDMTVVTLSGFDAENPLRTKGKYNFWVDSRSYGLVEMIHHLILHSMTDATIGAMEYSATMYAQRSPVRL